MLLLHAVLFFVIRKGRTGADITLFAFYDFLFGKMRAHIAENPRQITHLTGSYI